MHLSDLLGNAAPPASDVRRRLEALPAFAPAAHCLLSGPERSGKTSLLFQAAFSAARQGKRVLLLCRRYDVGHHNWPSMVDWSGMSLVALHLDSARLVVPCRKKLEQTPPLMPDGIAISDPSWQHVHIKYLDSGEAQAHACWPLAFLLDIPASNGKGS